MPRVTPVEPPPHLVDLPQDPRGYHVPSEVPWIEGAPKLADMDPHRTAALALLRACCVCGFELAEGATVWRNMSQKVAAFTRRDGRELTVDRGFAGHLSCMLYSAFACPYWASKSGRLGKNSTVEPGAHRGTRPAILGFEDIWFLIDEDPRVPVVGGPTWFAYRKLVEDLPFCDPSDLISRYEGAVAADSTDIDLTSERAYWQDTPEDVASLFGVIDRGVSAMLTAEVAQYIQLDRVDYRAFALPLV